MTFVMYANILHSLERTEKNAALMEAGLSIRLCRNALKGFGVSEDMLWDGIETVSGGITELCRLQQEGYSYIKP